MGRPGEEVRRATYADLDAVPAHQVAELIQGTLCSMSSRRSCFNGAADLCRRMGATHDCGEAFTFRTKAINRRPFDGRGSVGLDHFIRECPLSDCIEHTVAPACNGFMVGK